VNSLRRSLKREDNKGMMVPLKSVPTKQKSTPPTKDKEDKKNTVTRRTPPNRYQHIFLGYCYSCNSFGRKAVHCKAYRKCNPKNVQRYKKKRIMQRKETIIHSLLYNIKMLNVTSETIMVIKTVNVDFQYNPWRQELSIINIKIYGNKNMWKKR